MCVKKGPHVLNNIQLLTESSSLINCRQMIQIHIERLGTHHLPTETSLQSQLFFFFFQKLTMPTFHSKGVTEEGDQSHLQGHGVLCLDKTTALPTSSPSLKGT